MPGLDSFTKLLIHADGSDGSGSFTDGSASAHTITANGDAQVDTAQSVFGGASALFDGTGDTLSSVSSADWNLGGLAGGDFTIDFRVRWSALPASGDADVFISAEDSGYTVGWEISWNHAGQTALGIFTPGQGSSFLNWSPSQDTWYHVAVVRSGSTITAYIDGTSIGTFADHNMDNASQALHIGGPGAAAQFFNGWMDEIRISKGIARWTSNFTPPAAAYAADTLTFDMASAGMCVLP